MDNHNPYTFRMGMDRSQSKPAMVTLGMPRRMLSSDSILRGEREIGIEHHGALYRLKVTRQGKLILNK
ncbi:MAG: hemin uptake protein HemP [Pseudaminobacter sp.]